MLTVFLCLQPCTKPELYRLLSDKRRAQRHCFGNGEAYEEEIANLLERISRLEAAEAAMEALERQKQQDFQAFCVWALNPGEKDEKALNFAVGRLQRYHRGIQAR